MSRCRFLQTTGGMAVAMLAYNEVFGKMYEEAPRPSNTQCNTQFGWVWRERGARA